MSFDRLRFIKEVDLRKIRSTPSIEYADPAFIPIHLKGGIGDSILNVLTIEYLDRCGYEPVVYSKHAQALRYFTNITINDGDIPCFSWHLELDSVARFIMSKRFSGFINPLHKDLFNSQHDWFSKNPGMEYLVDNHPRNKHALTFMASDVVGFALKSLGIKDANLSLNLERKNEKTKQITIHDGYDTNSISQVKYRCTKQWPIGHWDSLVSHLKEKYPDYKIIQLGSKTAHTISFVDECLVNKTTITEAFDIISKSALHIDTDSGLVHAASFMGVPCVTLFGPTPLSFYGHNNNVNISSDKTCSGGCFFLEDDWMNRCPLYDSPKCMEDISPQTVLSRVENLLK